MSGYPVTITNAGTPVTPTLGGTPVTLVGGTAAAVENKQVVTLGLDGVETEVTFTVEDGVITAITTSE